MYTLPDLSAANVPTVVLPPIPPTTPDATPIVIAFIAILGLLVIASVVFVKYRESIDERYSE